LISLAPSAAQAQFLYDPYLPPAGPSPAYYIGYVASQGIPLSENGEPTLVEYDAEGEVVDTSELEPGSLVKSASEWNAWIDRWEQARTDFEDAGGITQALTIGEYNDGGRQCLDAEANAVVVSSVAPLSPEMQSALVVRVPEGLPACDGYVLAQAPLPFPLQRQDGNVSLVVDGAWGIRRTSEPGNFFALATGYFDADASGCAEASGVPPALRNLQAFVSCPAGSVQGVYAPVRGAELETTSQNSFVVVFTSDTGYYQLPYQSYGTVDDWSGDWVSAKLAFTRPDPRSPSSRYFLLRKRGVGSTVSFAVDTVQLRAHAILKNDPSSIVPVVDPDYEFNEFTQYEVEPGGVRSLDQGLLRQISAQDLRETDIYLFRVADNKLIGERRGMTPNELSGIALNASQFPGADVYPGCLGSACLSFVLVTRGPALSGGGGVSENNAFLPFASRPADGQPGLEPEYPDSPIRTFLRPGDAVKVVAINRATGYTGLALGKVHVGDGGLSVIADPVNPTEDLVIDMYPPNLRVRANRQYEVEYGATAGEQRNYIVGFEGSALNTDQLIVIRTEWFAPDDSPLPEGLPGLTGRLARVQMGELQAGGPTDAAGQALGQFAIEPGIKTSVVRLPEEGVEREHYYIHVDGAPLTGSVDFAGRAGISRPDFSVGEVCYYSTGFAQACFESQADQPELQSRPAQFVPFKVPVYDKAYSEAQRAAFLEQDLEDPGPVYRWPYRPEMQFTVHELQVEDVYRVEEDGTQVSVIADDVPSFFAGTTLSAGISYGIWGPLDDPLAPLSPTIDDVDGDGEREHRAFSWHLANMSFGDVLPNTVDSPELQIYNYLDDLDGELQADDYLALRLMQIGDEANVLWEFAALDFELEPSVDVRVPIAPLLTSTGIDPEQVGAETVLVASAFVGTEPVNDGSIIRWSFELNEGGAPALPETTETEEGYAAIKLTMPTTPGTRYQVKATLESMVVGGQLVPVGASMTSGVITVEPGEPHSINLTTTTTTLTASTPETAVLSALVRDRLGNAVADGTSVSFFAQGQGSVVPLGSEETEGGVVHAEVLPGLEAETLDIVVSSGRAQATQAFTVQAAQGTVTSSVATVNALANETAFLIANFVGEDGQPVPDGTIVHWLSTDGALSNQTSLTVGGQAINVLDPNGRVELNETGQPIEATRRGRGASGEIRVRAAVGPYSAWTSVSVSHDAYEYFLDPDRRILAGDTATGGAIEVEQVDGSTVSIPYHTGTTMTVRGPPGTHLRVTVPPPKVPGFGLEGIENYDLELTYQSTPVQQGNEVIVVFDETGEAQIEVTVTNRLRKTFFTSSENSADPVANAGTVVREVLRLEPITPGGDNAGPVMEAEIPVTDSAFIAGLKNFWAGFKTGEGTGLAGFAGDFVAGILVYGDLRDIAIGTSLWVLGTDVFGTDREFDRLNYFFAWVGLAFTVATVISGGAAAPFKALVAGAKSLLKQIWRLKGLVDPAVLLRTTEQIEQLTKEVIQSTLDDAPGILSRLEDLGGLFVKMVDLGTDITRLRGLVRILGQSDVGLRNLFELYQQWGDDIVDAMADIGKLADDIADEAAQAKWVASAAEALATAGKFGDEAIDGLRREGRLAEAMQGLTKAIDGGNVDGELLSDVMNTTQGLWTETIGATGRLANRTDYLKALGNLAKAPGLQEAVKGAKGQNNAGRWWEIIFASELQELGFDILHLSKEVFRKNGSVLTDFDVVARAPDGRIIIFDGKISIGGVLDGAKIDKFATAVQEAEGLASIMEAYQRIAYIVPYVGTALEAPATLVSRGIDFLALPL
jgi:hypothetical protein